MANWLQKFMAPVPTGQTQPPSRNALVKVKPGALTKTDAIPAPDVLPAASIVYGIAASVLIIIAVYFLFTGRWFTSFLVLVPAVCFLGFALHFMSEK